MLIGQAHSQFLGGFIVTRKMQSTDWSGLGHVTTLGIGMQIHSSKPHGLRVGFPQGKIKVQFLEEGMLHRIKYIYIYMFIYVSIWNAETWKVRVVLRKCLRPERVLKKRISTQLERTRKE